MVVSQTPCPVRRVSVVWVSSPQSLSDPTFHRVGHMLPACVACIGPGPEESDPVHVVGNSSELQGGSSMEQSRQQLVVSHTVNADLQALLDWSADNRTTFEPKKTVQWCGLVPALEGLDRAPLMPGELQWSKWRLWEVHQGRSKGGSGRR